MEKQSMAMMFGTNSAALILRRSGLCSFSLSLWERVGVRVLSSSVPRRKAPSPGLRPASPRGRGKIDRSPLVGHIPCRTGLPSMALARECGRQRVHLGNTRKRQGCSGLPVAASSGGSLYPPSAMAFTAAATEPAPVAGEPSSSQTAQVRGQLRRAPRDNRWSPASLRRSRSRG